MKAFAQIEKGFKKNYQTFTREDNKVLTIGMSYSNSKGCFEYHLNLVGEWGCKTTSEKKVEKLVNEFLA